MNFINENESINERVARWRNERNMTQADLADKMGLKCSTYSQMERNGNITAEKLLIIEKELNLPQGTLLYGEELVPKTDSTLTLSEPKLQFPQEETLLLTNNEKNYIKILRQIPKEDRNEVLNVLQQKFDEYMKKK